MVPGGSVWVTSWGGRVVYSYYIVTYTGVEVGFVCRRSFVVCFTVFLIGYTQVANWGTSIVLG